jgi:hypothetical protein
MLLIYRYVEGLKLTCQNECRRMHIYMANCILHVPWLFLETSSNAVTTMEAAKTIGKWIEMCSNIV